jgi:hypothetical protein
MVLLHHRGSVSTVQGNDKGKGHPATCDLHRLALDRVASQHHAAAALPLEKDCLL